jgi:predicted nucleic acid-binding protein
VPPKVYLETSVVSYLVSRRNQRDLLVAANQELTDEWWEKRRTKFEVYVSAIVLAEAGRGDPTMASARLEVVRGLPLVQITPFTATLADALLKKTGLPRDANEDALHIAAAATAGLDYLLTWNCKHIANGVIVRRVNEIIRGHGLEPPLIYTPQELMEDVDAG